MMTETMRLVLKNPSGETVTLTIDNEETFLELKGRVKQEVGIALDLQDLTIKGKTITDDQKVVDYFTSQDTTEESNVNEENNKINEDVKCAVPGCFNTKVNCPDKAFFSFPLEEVRCHQWALYCQRLSDQSGKHRVTLNVNSTICADHFRKDQFVKNTTTLLKRTAVPCIKPELPVSNESNNGRRKSLSTSLSSPSVSVKNDRIFDDNFFSGLTNVSAGILCRLCASTSSDMLLIYDEVGMKYSISEKINVCLPVTVRNTDPLPKQICRSCYDKLNIVNDMVEMCVKAENKLKELVKDKHFRSHELPALKTHDSTDETADSISGTNNSEQTGDGNDDNTSLIHEISNGNTSCYCCPLCSSGKMITKSGIYKTSNLNPSCNNKNPSQQDNEEQNDDGENSGEEIFSVEDVTESKNLWNGQEFGLKIPDLDMDSLYPDCIVGMDLDPIQEEPWDNEVKVKSEEPSSNKTDISCRLCGMDFTNIAAVLEHSHTHADAECFPCSFCDRYYPTRADLETHFQEHKIMKKKFVSASSDTPLQYFQCETCGAAFKSAFKFQSHNCSNNVNSSNRCSHCNKSFRSEARLKFHERFHQGAKPGYCDLCQKTFPDEVKLYKHTVYLHSQSKGHCCEECGKVFRSVSSLRYHQRSHQGEDVMKPYSCEQCGKCFIRKSMLRNHMLATHKNLSQEGTCFTCKICLEAFPSTDHAVSHMDIHHMSQCTGETTYSFEMHHVSRLYICEYCERCFTDPMQLSTHRDQHAPDLPYQCKLCSMSFTNYSQLDEHKPIHNTDDNTIQDYAQDFTIPAVYMCEYCERCFLNYIKLSEHLTVHYGENPYQCRFCDLRFKTFSEVSEHRVTHDQYVAPIDDFDYYRPYECHYCRKAFAIEDALVKHIRMHTGEKPFICDQCGKGFSQSSGLYTHQKVHSDERPYSCTFCSRTFKIKGDRDVHVRKHSGDRPYTCDYCGKSFMTQHVYSQHRKIHTGERPYKCDVCGIAFRRSHVLTVHKRIHTGEKPNICDICGKRYRQKGDMLKHRRIQHGIVKVKVQKVEF
ncbi:uncharacterized protein LOC142325225 isoform X2 [Lycorma delicatula]|uniref:uncharacterized protein LOC142325225 isoform X2 n=1 Tax=Lycorma delicatula TaxID=130591 RepID=UPI003F517BE2